MHTDLLESADTQLIHESTEEGFLQVGSTWFLLDGALHDGAGEAAAFLQ